VAGDLLSPIASIYRHLAHIIFSLVSLDVLPLLHAADYVYHIPVGAPLADLPQSSVLLPRSDRLVWNIKITQAPVTYKVNTQTLPSLPALASY
jgi:hypothetical protein